MFQTSVLTFEIEEENDIVSLDCHAQIKLPILRKEAFFSTEYSRVDDQWLTHKPFHDNPSSAKLYKKNQLELADVIDPLSFFLAIDEGRWSGDTAKIFLGEKSLSLDVSKSGSEYILRRPSKDQTLFVGIDSKGIEYFKVKVPMLGEIKLQRI